MIQLTRRGSLSTCNGTTETSLVLLCFDISPGQLHILLQFYRDGQCTITLYKIKIKLKSVIWKF
jgi:hypothetical protein